MQKLGRQFMIDLEARQKHAPHINTFMTINKNN